MSGSFVLNRFGTNNVPEQWSWGRHGPNPNYCDVLVRKYPEHATDWSEFQSEEDETMAWEQVLCNVLYLNAKEPQATT